jgi:hypothetical protein
MRAAMINRSWRLTMRLACRLLRKRMPAPGRILASGCRARRPLTLLYCADSAGDGIRSSRLAPGRRMPLAIAWTSHVYIAG